MHLADDDPKRIADRLSVLRPIWTQFTDHSVTRRTGQALEIAVYRSLLAAPGIHVFNGFTDLDAHDDSTLYSKHEIHVLNGRSLGNRALDFIGQVGNEFLGVEAKNTRPWLYPNDAEVREALRKALTIGVVPVLVARRIPYVTFRVLGACGVLMHETYNQRLAVADAHIAEQARDKSLLGYHDIRIGNEPDARLNRFTAEYLPQLVAGARQKLDEFDDLLHGFAWAEMPYQEFAARVRRRESGQNEDHDWEDDEPPNLFE